MSKKEQSNYYAIIPATVRYDTNLKYANYFAKDYAKKCINNEQ